MRDIRILNQTQGQQIEYDEVLNRIGRLENRNLSALAKIALFDEGKALITSGFRVEAYSGMTVKVPTGTIVQREIDLSGNHGDIVGVCIQTEDQLIAMDAADGVPRTDIVEGQIISVVDRTDNARIGNVVTGGGDTGSVVITNEIINRDLKYSLSVQKQKGTTTPTAATSASLTGTVAIAATIDLSEQYLLYMADGEDSDWQEIDCRGAIPAATTRAEIISAINTAVGRTMAADGAGNTVELTGQGTGERSYFAFKPPITDSNADALETIFDVSTGGFYKWEYTGTNSWIKLAEIDIGAADVEITAEMIRNLDGKGSWTGNDDEIILKSPIMGNLNTEQQIKIATMRYLDEDNDTNSNAVQIYSFAYNNNVWVAVGNGDHMTSDKYAKNWITRTRADASAGFNGVIYGNSLFVAVGDVGATTFGSIETSPDGITWTQRTGAAVANNLKDIDWNGSLFVTCGELGLIETSENGTTGWTQRTPDGGSSQNFYAVKWIENLQLWVIVGDEDCQTSSDGITWTQQTLPNVTGLQLKQLIWSDHERKIVACTTGKLYTSSNGTTWSEITSLPGIHSDKDDFYGIAYGKNMYWIVATGGGYSSAGIYISFDLSEFYECKGISNVLDFYTADYNDGIFLAGGEDTSGDGYVVSNTKLLIS